MRIDRCFIDANWGQATDVVYQFCRQSQFAGVLLPSHGRYGRTAVAAAARVRRRRHARRSGNTIASGVIKSACIGSSRHAQAAWCGAS